MAARTLVGRGITMVIDGRPILEQVDLTCVPGSVTALVGASGSGKTTLLNCLSLLQRPTGGKVLIDNIDTTPWRNSRRRRFWRDDASFILQDYGVIEDETVAFNVTMTMSLFGRKWVGNLEQLHLALALANLEGRLAERAAHLSGGEKQRLGVARSIYKKAGCLFIDEPTASLDRGNRELVMQLFRRCADEGNTVVIATHDELVIDASDQRVELEAATDWTVS